MANKKESKARDNKSGCNKAIRNREVINETVFKVWEAEKGE
jgi:hypothetical protein